MSKTKSQKARAKALRSGVVGPVINPKDYSRMLQAVQQGRKAVANAPRRRGPRSKKGGRAGPGGLEQKYNGGGPDQNITSGDEFIAAVNGVTATGIIAFSVNPAQAATFPLLSKKCSNQFQKYHFIDLEFYYRRMVSEFATNGSQGKVILAFNHDAADAVPATQQQLEDYVPPNRSDGMPCTPEIRIKIPSRDLSRQDSFYLRPAGLPGSTDIKTYDVGNLFVGVVGCANTTQIGELRCKYKVRFIDPVLENTASAPINNSVAQFNSSTGESGGATSVAAVLLLATATANGIQAVNTAGSIVLPAGNYIIDLTASGYCSGNVLSNVFADILKNGTSIFPVPSTALGPNCQRPDTANLAITLQVSLQSFITSNGTDAFTFPVTGAYSAGALTIYGQVRIAAL